MKRKCFSLILSLLLLLPGCAGGSGGETDTGKDTASAPDTTTAAPPETSIVEALPTPDLGGKTFRMLGVSKPTRRNFPAEEDAGERVNDALVDRDLAVSERLNIKIQTHSEADSAVVTKTVQDSVLGGDDVCDIVISDIASSLLPLMNSAALYDLRQMDHLSLEEGWWSSGMYKNAAINGKQYITMGDISPMKYYAPYCLAYNQKLAKDFGHSDLYDEVLEGKWTIDLFHSMLQDVNRDLDGDGDVDQLDFHGYAHVSTGITAWAHYTGAGQVLSTVDKDGKIVIPIGSDDSIRVIEKVRQILGYSPGLSGTEAMFKEDRALFYGNSYAGIIANFREMESDFSVIPTPKYDEQQDHYSSFINTWASGGVAVPNTCKDPDTIGLIMETLCRVSFLEVRPALYESTIKSRVARNKEDAQMLDIIFNNTYIDCNSLFNIGGSAEVVERAILGQAEFASSYAAVKESIEASIEELMKFGQ